MLQRVALVFVLGVVVGSLGLRRAAAQIVPAAPQVPPSGALAVEERVPATKVVRIYNGAGYFDDALAEKLRPMLAKAFPSSGPDRVQAVLGMPVAAPAKPDNQKKVPKAAPL